MTIFWLLAAALIVVTMAGLLPPLLRASRAPQRADTDTAADLYRGQLDELEADLRAGTVAPEHRREARDEVGRRLLDDAASLEAASPARSSAASRPSPLLAALLLALIPSAAIVLYLHLGNPIALWQAADPDHAHEVTGAPSAAQIEGMVNQLAQRLRSEPDDPEGWVMLARSYAALERPGDAAMAFAKAVTLSPDEPALRADYADVLASVEGGVLNGLALAQIQRALALDPDQPKALALSASAAMERGDTQEALRQWQHLHRLLPPDSQTAARVAANIAQIGTQAAPDKAGPQPLPAEAITGRVRLADQLPRTPAANETVFVYARAAEGPRIPLAVMKRRAGELPFSFTLDDSLAMRPDHRLSGAGRVIVEARISPSGQAMPAEGDLIGSAGPIEAGARDLRIVIDGVVEARPTQLPSASR
ncbi:cytochrome c-type biogenesis protein CcmH [Variovorax sp. HW608]|uniref:c-type cytochrome biogenesis protein CcmI n=1 Tax=Variovorax sp. HW608 TaxID=1034889 RepID=UPI00081FB982|nr:c-type cytochrome biogenesis protein CcmI [Variovorax sp. HW608]SCK58530.1 cytochrome c-type biogenesis protein CcmH [Variovorax sp. HW608]